MEYSEAPSGIRSRRASFAQRLFLGLGRHLRFLNGLLEVRELRAGSVGFAELLLDLAQTLAQHGLLLPLVEGLAGALVDLAGDLEHFHPPIDQRQNAVEARLQVESRQEFLFVGGFQVHEACDGVGQRRDGFDAADGVDEFRGRLRQQLQRLQRPLAQVDAAGFDFAIDHGRIPVAFDPGHEERLLARVVEDGEAFLALADHMMRAVRRRDEAQDGGDRAHAVQRVGAGLVALVLLKQYADAALRAHGLLGGGHGTLAVNRQRQHDTGKQHHVALRQDDQHVLGSGGARRRIVGSAHGVSSAMRRCRLPFSSRCSRKA